jgi:hypothetical protein
VLLPRRSPRQPVLKRSLQADREGVPAFDRMPVRENSTPQRRVSPGCSTGYLRGQYRAVDGGLGVADRRSGTVRDGHQARVQLWSVQRRFGQRQGDGVRCRGQDGILGRRG